MTKANSLPGGIPVELWDDSGTAKPYPPMGSFPRNA